MFTPRQRRILTCFSAALIPPGRVLSGGGDATLARLESFLIGLPPSAATPLRISAWLIELAALPFTGRLFSRLSADAASALVARWSRHAPALLGIPLRLIIALFKSAHFNDPDVYQALGLDRAPAAPPAEAPRWLTQMTDGAEVSADVALEVDVVVVGTGAGGAPLAYELAARGHAVLMLEEGRYFGRHDFTGRATEMTRKTFRDGGMTFALGNVLMPIWAGVTVGGSTTVNSGTCYRTPARTLKRWHEELGLGMLSPEALAPYFTKVEHVLGVGDAQAGLLGGGARVMARGAERLGYSAHVLQRNAPDCDGRGRCIAGCPTDAKRGTNVSYVPMALGSGAGLFARTKVERVLVENGRARGVVARTAGGATVTVHARATVLACGALMTPLLLQDNGLCAGSEMVGRNLSAHPAAAVLALFSEPVDMHRGIPQGFVVDHFADEGLMFEEAGNPPEAAAMALPLTGRRFTAVMEQYRQLAAFGYMIQDTSRGSVRRGKNGQLQMSYWVNGHDRALLKRGAAALSELFLAAGATAVFPCVRGVEELSGPADLARLRGRRLAAADFTLSAVHPLGTARMGLDGASSVVGPDHETHEVRDLYITDGSAVPTSLGVNPQITIMALSVRAAELLDRRLGN